jgi:hypothetical protein
MYAYALVVNLEPLEIFNIRFGEYVYYSFRQYGIECIELAVSERRFRSEETDVDICGFTHSSPTSLPLISYEYWSIKLHVPSTRGIVLMRPTFP